MSPATRRGRGWRRLVVPVVAASLLAVACGGGGGSDGGDGAAPPGTGEDTRDEGEARTGGTVVMALEAETNEWTPGRGAFANAGYNVLFAVYDTFTKRTEEGEVRPYLAESLAPNADLTVWTMGLRPGVRFHDGTPLDASAVETIYERHLTGPGSNLAGALTDLDEVTVIDDRTVEFRLVRGNAAFPDVLATAAGMPFSPTNMEQRGPDAGDHPVGTGPFRFVSWQRDAELVVERNPDYWREGLPYLDRVVFRPIPDEDARLASLLSGDVDAMQTLRQSIVRQALDEDAIEVHTFVGNNAGGGIFNTRQPPVDDVRVRRALVHALVQEDLIAVLGGAGLVPDTTQYFSPDDPYHSAEAARRWPDADPDRAAELLAEYVDDPARSDGRPVGSPVAVEFACPPDPSLIEFSQLVQASWQAVGVEVTLEQVEQATHIQRGLSDDYVVNCWRMGGQQDPYLVLAAAFGPPETQPLNFTNYTSPVVEENLEVLRTSTDVPTRKAAVEEIMLDLADAVPHFFAGGTLSMVATVPEVDNVAGWTLPDGTKGDGVPVAQVMWGEVWRR